MARGHYKQRLQRLLNNPFKSYLRSPSAVPQGAFYIGFDLTDYQ